MWVVGILSAVAYAYVFAQSALWAAMLFQVYYFFVSIYGLFCWRRDKKLLVARSSEDSANTANTDTSITYRVIPLRSLFMSGVACVLIFAAIYWLLARFTGDPMPVLDAVVATLGIVATYWLGKSYIHQWLLWVAVNVLSVCMFVSQDLYLTAFLYILYTLCAFYGFVHWKKKGVEISV